MLQRTSFRAPPTMPAHASLQILRPTTARASGACISVGRMNINVSVLTASSAHLAKHHTLYCLRHVRSATQSLIIRTGPKRAQAEHCSLSIPDLCPDDEGRSSCGHQAKLRASIHEPRSSCPSCRANIKSFARPCWDPES